MAKHSGLIVNLTIKVDSGVLLLAKYRALLERTTINRHLADCIEDFADGTMDAARRTGSAAYVFGVVEEYRRLRRRSKAARRPIHPRQAGSRDIDDEDGENADDPVG